MSFSFDGIYRSTTYALEHQAAAMALLQEQVSTGSQINRGSDNPSDSNRVMALNSYDSELEYFIKEMDSFSDRLNVISELFSAVSTQLTDFGADLTSALSKGQDAKNALAAGIDDLIGALLSVANAQQEGERFFGGADSASTPYVVEKTNGLITKVTYQGSYEDRKVEVAPNVKLSSVFVGDEVFRENDRQAVEIISSNGTGLQVGSGTSSVQGYFEIEVTKPAANYVLSIDGGLSTVTVPIGGDANTAVTDSRTGRVLYVDTTGLADTGTVTANAAGTDDVFNVLISIRDLLLDTNDVKDELKAVTESFQSVHKKIVNNFSVIGGRASTIGIMRDGYENVKFSSKEEVARLQDADIAQVMVDLTRRETLYQMSMGIAGKLLSNSLMNFL